MKEFIAPFLTNLTIFHKERTPDHVFYKQDGEVLFELYQAGKNRYFVVNYAKIWSVFENRFSLNYSDTRSFITKEANIALKLGDVLPCYYIF